MKATMPLARSTLQAMNDQQKKTRRNACSTMNRTYTKWRFLPPNPSQTLIENSSIATS